MISSMKNDSIKKMQVLSVAVVLALGSAAVFAQARQATPDNAKPRTQQLDVNKDGVIDRAEAAKAPMLAKRFDQMDTNKDGTLSADERAQMRAQMRGTHARGAMGGGHGGMMALDADKDGRVSRAEMQAGHARMVERFDQMDVNKDGYLDKADMQARQSKRRAELFDAADANHDGALSRAEFDAFKGEGGGMRHGKGHGANHGMGDAKVHAAKP